MGSILEYLPRREPTLKRDVLPNYLPTRAGARRPLGCPPVALARPPRADRPSDG
jgi:hypothetical protein